MSKKENIINTLIMSFIFALVFTLLAQYITMGTISLQTVPRDFILGFAVGLAVSFIIPTGKIAVNAAFKLKAQPGTAKFDVIVGAVFAVIFAIVMSFVMSLISGCIIGHAPVVPVLVGTLKTLWIYILAAFIIGLLVTKPVGKLAHRLSEK